jgi:rhodanese-related sulfurtransferase
MDWEITPEELKRHVDNGHSLTVLDVREYSELQTACLKGVDFIHIPMGEITMRVNQELDPDDHIVVLCHHGVRSANVVAWLRQQGFERAQSLRGGIDRWSRAVDPSVPTY